MTCSLHNKVANRYNALMSVREQLHEVALKAPLQSGVYFWKDEHGTIICKKQRRENTHFGFACD